MDTTSNKRRKGLWAEFLKNETEVHCEEHKRGERMRSLSRKWRDKMSGLTTISIEYLMYMKEEHQQMRCLIAARNAEIKDLKERVIYLESVLNEGVKTDFD